METNSWFLVKAKYTKELRDGTLKRVNEPYLIGAVSFTDAEARIYEELGSFVRGEFVVANIGRANFTEVFPDENAETWFKCKITYVSMDGDSGKEKSLTNFFLVAAKDLRQAYDVLKESLSASLISFEVVYIQKTPIIEVFPPADMVESDNEADFGTVRAEYAPQHEEEVEEYDDQEETDQETFEADDDSYDEEEEPEEDDLVAEEEAEEEELED